MGLYVFIAVEWVACLVVVVLIVRAVRRGDAEAEARVQKLAAEKRVEIDAAWAEAARAQAALAALPPELVLELDYSDDEPSPDDLFAASEHAKLLVSSLSEQEQALGGSGLTLTAARVEFGAVRLTLSPVERVGSAERVRRVADEWNARGGPLPPGVTAARADVSAA